MASLLRTFIQDGANLWSPFVPNKIKLLFVNMKYLQPLMPLIVGSTAAVVPYNEYILAPESRTLYPVSVFQINGTVVGAESLTGSTSGNATFDGLSSVTFDYGKNIAGVVSVTIGGSSSTDAFIGLTYTESSYWISGLGSDATGDTTIDEILWFNVGKGPGIYTVETWHERGAFKYLSLISNTTATVEVTGIVTNYTAAPAQDLRAYKGYFHSNDELLNRIWYAGAYTNQLCTINPNYGDSLIGLFGDVTTNPQGTAAWYNNYTISNGTSVITDGAKRDRLVWPGDLAVALPSIFTSTNDLDSVKNAIDSLLVLQNPETGLLPYAGTPFSQLNIVSFTYHLYTLIGISNFYHYSGDIAYLQSTWPNFKNGLAWSLRSIDSSGLMNVTSSADWLRNGMGGHNIEANAILYYTLNEAINLASVLGEPTTTIQDWSTKAAAIKQAANALLWDQALNLYKDNENSTIYPQDGNSWAIKSNLTLSSAQVTAISSALKARWGTFGAPAPEAGATVSPFISSFELESHFLAGKPQDALDLMRLQWGFMLNDPRMTNSTFIEGYSTDGSLQYAPYSNDPRVSHAHGWATGPTSSLSFYVAGIHLTSSVGKTWLFSPALDDLTSVDAGFETPLGEFKSFVKASDGGIVEFAFSAPAGTSGDVVLLGVQGSLVSSAGQNVQLTDGKASELEGGDWHLVLS